MKFLIICLSVLPISIFAQKNHLSYTSAVFVPFSQQSQIVNALKFPSRFANSDIKLLPSSYFGGFTYKRDLFESNYSINFGTLIGLERQNVTLYNDIADYYQYPDFAYQFEDVNYETFKAIFNLGLERKYQLSGGFFDELSLMAGYSFSLHQDRKGKADRKFTVNAYPQTIDGEDNFYTTEVTISQIQKTMSNFNVGASMRKNIGQNFYLELNGNILPFNKIDYSYDAISSKSNNSGAVEIYNWGTNQVKYNLLSLQLNLGYKF